MDKFQRRAAEDQRATNKLMRNALIAVGGIAAFGSMLVGGGDQKATAPEPRNTTPSNERQDTRDKSTDPIERVVPPMAMSLGSTTNSIEPSPTDVNAPVRQLIKQGLTASPKDRDLNVGRYWPACGGQTVELPGSNGVTFSVELGPGFGPAESRHTFDPVNDEVRVYVQSPDGSVLPTQLLYPGTSVETWGAGGLAGATSEGISRAEWDDYTQRTKPLSDGTVVLGPDLVFPIGQMQGENRLRLSVQFDRGNGIETATATADVQRVVEGNRATYAVQSLGEAPSRLTLEKGEQVCGLEN